MANIGFLNADQNGKFIGKIETLAFTNVIGIVPIAKTKENSPAFDVYAKASANNWVKIGALWEQTSRSSGESFYQGRIDDPSMARPMDIALFSNREGGFNIAWTRRRTRQDMPIAHDGNGAMGENVSDGLGVSTADDAAFLTSVGNEEKRKSKTSDKLTDA